MTAIGDPVGKTVVGKIYHVLPPALPWFGTNTPKFVPKINVKVFTHHMVNLPNHRLSHGIPNRCHLTVPHQRSECQVRCGGVTLPGRGGAGALHYYWVCQGGTLPWLSDTQL